MTFAGCQAFSSHGPPHPGQSKATGEDADGFSGGRSAPSTVLLGGGAFGGAGSLSRWPHFGQAVFLPALSSGAVRVVLQAGQRKWIMAGSPKKAERRTSDAHGPLPQGRRTAPADAPFGARQVPLRLDTSAARRRVVISVERSLLAQVYQRP